jgi:hypothetical protein
MKHLITPAEVIDLAFSPHEPVSPWVVTDARIETAQLRFLAPALGGLYPALSLEKYENFLRERVKPALAHFVRSLILPQLVVRTSSEGILRNGPADSVPADDAAIARLRKDARRTAKSLLADTLEYLREHAGEFPEFTPAERRCRPAEVRGGVIV